MNGDDNKYAVRLLRPLALTKNDLRIVVSLALRPGQPRTEHELGVLLWGERDWSNDSRVSRLRPPVARARQHLSIPAKPRNSSTYKSDLERSEVDLTDFVDTVAKGSLSPEVVDDLLGLWGHDPAMTYDFMGKGEFGAVTRARLGMVKELESWSPAELSGLANLAAFRELFPEETKNLSAGDRSDQPRVLLIDDSVQLTDSLQVMLADYPCIVAHTAAEAMEIISNPAANLGCALVDLKLSEYGEDEAGYGLLGALRTNHPSVPRVLLTSQAPGGQAELIRKYGLFEILVKRDLEAPAVTRATVDAMMGTSPESRRRQLLARLLSHARSFEERLKWQLIDLRRAYAGAAIDPEKYEAIIDKITDLDRATGAVERAAEDAPLEDVERAVDDYVAEWAERTGHAR